MLPANEPTTEDITFPSVFTYFVLSSIAEPMKARSTRALCVIVSSGSQLSQTVHARVTLPA